MNGEAFVVECVEDGGKKGPPVNVKWLILENGVAPVLLPESKYIPPKQVKERNLG